MEERRFTYEELKTFTSSVLQSLGYPGDRADETARVLVEADARGVPSHGVARLKFYEHNLKGGFAVPDAEPETVHETPLSAVIDGHDGIGPYVSRYALAACMKKAREVGAGFVAVRNSNHFGMAGLWAEEAAREGMIGMAFTNTRKCGIVTYGREKLLGTNPIAVAIPTGEGKEPFLLDMATTTVAHGKIEVYDRRDKEMPLGWAVWWNVSARAFPWEGGASGLSRPPAAASPTSSRPCGWISSARPMRCRRMWQASLTTSATANASRARTAYTSTGKKKPKSGPPA